MNTGTVALLVAVVGVAGTLLAPVTTAWVSSRSRRQEFELQQRSELTKRHMDDEQANLERLRDTYVALNSGARRYRFRMMEDLYAIRSGTARTPRRRSPASSSRTPTPRPRCSSPTTSCDGAKRYGWHWPTPESS
ncbi:hypothetical protein ACFV1U_23685 [Streptomyces microflavus]|uniref:hypothetical protein n=1 Tax=Streptomyces microflavus TaxID=1919 RepID=UPI0036B0F32C